MLSDNMSDGVVGLQNCVISHRLQYTAVYDAIYDTATSDH